MANVTVTTNAVFIPEVWTAETLRATEANLVMAKKVKRYDQDVMKHGDTIHIPNVANMTASAKSADTAVTYSANTEAENTITIDKHKYVARIIEDIAGIQSKYNILQEYTDKMGYALAKQIDTDLLGLYSGLSQSVGSSGVDIDDGVILDAINYLDLADAPESDRSLIIYPTQKKALLSLDKFVLAQNANKDRINTGKLGEIFGVEINVSTNVPSSSGRRNLLIHKEAFALASQKAPTFVTEQSADYLGLKVVAHTLYGVAELRDAFGVQVIS